MEVARGVVKASEVGTGKHHDGYLRALDKALDALDDQAHAGKELNVHFAVQVSPNPGGITGYIVFLSDG